MMAITTSSSIKVNAEVLRFMDISVGRNIQMGRLRAACKAFRHAQIKQAAGGPPVAARDTMR
jgi:hypothetical protein